MNKKESSKAIPQLSLTLGQRLILFLCLTLFCLVVVGFITGFLTSRLGQTPALMRIAAVAQSVFVFVLPSIVTAVFITRLPARFLCIDVKPKLSVCVIACLVLFVSIPAMNGLIVWNENITLPESMAGIEKWMRAAEVSARSSIEMLFGGQGVGALIVGILIVGVLAGFSEELFFRGTFQRLLSTGGVNHHIAIWIVAFIFSATHLQFYGFFGRLLLGAYFGYLLYWSGSVWLPMLVHVINNTAYILGNRFTAGSGSDVMDVNTIGSDNWVMIVVSVICVIFGIVLLKRLCAKLSKVQDTSD